MQKKQYLAIVKYFNEKVVETISQYKYRDMWINYLLTIFQSKFYTESVYHDIQHFEPYIAHGSRILDFGAGGGYMSMFFAEKASEIEALEYSDPDVCKHIIPSDPTYNMALQQKQLWEKISADYPMIHFSHYSGKSIPFTDQSFDSILAYAVLEHIPDELAGKYLDEFNRILKQGGTVLVSYLPRKLAYMEHLARLLGLGYHERLYGDKEFQRVMESHGFEKTTQGRKNLFPAYPSKIMNVLFPILKWIEPVLLLTPLSFFAHNIWAVYHKVEPSLESIEN